jgi:hypothetical protein
LKNILRSRLLKKDIKCKIYKTLMRPVVLYRGKSWTLVRTDEEKLNIFERKILKIYGPSCVNRVWRAKYNDELYNLYKEPNTVKVIKIARLKCQGHIARMEDNAPCRKITFSQPEGSMKKGRCKLKWLDSAIKHFKTLKETEWWRTSQDRDWWSKIIKEAKAHMGL